MRVKLLNDGGFRFMKGIALPVEIKAEQHSFLDGAVHVNTQDLIEIGAGSTCKMLPRWSFHSDEFELISEERLMRQLTASEASNGCVGILGAAFGHKWVDLTVLTFHLINQNARSCWAILPKYAADDFINGERQVCRRCGLVTGVIMTSNDDMERQRFEKWLTQETGCEVWRTNYPMTPKEDQQYVDHHVNLAWMAWQAALKSKQGEV